MKACYNQSELSHSVNVFKDTIPLMRNNGIPLTPENYALWYTYSVRKVQGLNQAIEKNLKAGIEFSKQINQALYDQYIHPNDSRTLGGFQQATKELIEKLLSELKEVSGDSNDFVCSMEECEKQLMNNPDVGQLTQIVSEVIKKTKNITATNQGLVENLKDMESEVSTLKSGVDSLTELAYTDPLTKIANRRSFEKYFDSLQRNYEQSGEEFSLLLIDIDHFKQFNDTYGHAIGDRVLTYVAGCLSAGISSDDIAARFGGEEFVVALKGIEQPKSIEIADNLRIEISKKNLRSNQAKETLGNITVSIGVATIEQQDNIESLLERADNAMYQAKADGRNRVCGHVSE